MTNTNNQNGQNLLKPAEAAAMLTMSPATLARWRCQGHQNGPRFIKIGGAVRYRAGDITSYINGLAAANDD